MTNRFASGKKAISICDRCGFQFLLKDLKELAIKGKKVNLLVCNECWEPSQPQLQLGSFPVDDPQGLRNPRPDSSYVQSGLLADGEPGGGSRDIQWGWNPVGGSRGIDAPLTPNNLVLDVEVGTVAIVVT
jgi:hypothetical protein